MKQIKQRPFLYFSISLIMIFILLASTILIKNQSHLIVCYSMVFCFGLLAYYCIYGLCQQMTLYAQLEAQNVLLSQQQNFQEDYLLISKENQKIFNEMGENIYEKIDSFQDITIQNEDEAREFAKKLINEYSSLYQIDYCSNKIIDAILSNKVTLAKHYHIQTSVQVIVPEDISIRSSDIMSVYTNLLDNAIEACLELPEKDRFIQIDSMVKSQYLIIKVVNSKNESLQVDSSNLKTSKLDKEEHGLGTQIIKKACKQNNGSFKIIDHGHTLEAYVTLGINVE